MMRPKNVSHRDEKAECLSSTPAAVVESTEGRTVDTSEFSSRGDEAGSRNRNKKAVCNCIANKSDSRSKKERLECLNICSQCDSRDKRAESSSLNNRSQTDKSMGNRSESNSSIDNKPESSNSIDNKPESSSGKDRFEITRRGVVWAVRTNNRDDKAKSSSSGDDRTMSSIKDDRAMSSFGDDRALSSNSDNGTESSCNANGRAESRSCESERSESSCNENDEARSSCRESVNSESRYKEKDQSESSCRDDDRIEGSSRKDRTESSSSDNDGMERGSMLSGSTRNFISPFPLASTRRQRNLPSDISASRALLTRDPLLSSSSDVTDDNSLSNVLFQLRRIRIPTVDSVSINFDDGVSSDRLSINRVVSPNSVLPARIRAAPESASETSSFSLESPQSNKSEQLKKIDSKSNIKATINDFARNVILRSQENAEQQSALQSSSRINVYEASASSNANKGNSPNPTLASSTSANNDELCDTRQDSHSSSSSFPDGVQVNIPFNGSSVDTLQKPPKTPPSDCAEEVCPICLSNVTNPGVTSICMHRFCFECIKRWVSESNLCPLCKRKIPSIIHNIKADDAYEEYQVFERREERLSFPFLEFLLPNVSPPRLFQSNFLSHGPLPSPSSLSFRRRVYSLNLWVQFTTIHYRESSPTLYRTQEALTHRLYPWVEREIRVLNCSALVVEEVMRLITEYHISSPEMEHRLSHAIRRHTRHFLHEFNCFAHSSYDMLGHDRACQGRYGRYEDRVCPPGTHSGLIEIDLTDDGPSEASITSTSEIEPVGSQSVRLLTNDHDYPLSLHSRSNRRTFITKFNFNGSGANSATLNIDIDSDPSNIRLELDSDSQVTFTTRPRSSAALRKPCFDAQVRKAKADLAKREEQLRSSAQFANNEPSSSGMRKSSTASRSCRLPKFASKRKISSKRVHTAGQENNTPISVQSSSDENENMNPSTNQPNNDESECMIVDERINLCSTHPAGALVESIIISSSDEESFPVNVENTRKQLELVKSKSKKLDRTSFEKSLLSSASNSAMSHVVPNSEIKASIFEADRAGPSSSHLNNSPKMPLGLKGEPSLIKSSCGKERFGALLPRIDSQAATNLHSMQSELIASTHPATTYSNSSDGGNCQNDNVETNISVQRRLRDEDCYMGASSSVDSSRSRSRSPSDNEISPCPLSVKRSPCLFINVARAARPPISDSDEHADENCRARMFTSRSGSKRDIFRFRESSESAEEFRSTPFKRIEHSNRSSKKDYSRRRKHSRSSGYSGQFHFRYRSSSNEDISDRRYKLKNIDKEYHQPNRNFSDEESDEELRSLPFKITRYYECCEQNVDKNNSRRKRNVSSSSNEEYSRIRNIESSDEANYCQRRDTSYNSVVGAHGRKKTDYSHRRDGKTGGSSNSRHSRCTRILSESSDEDICIGKRSNIKSDKQRKRCISTSSDENEAHFSKSVKSLFHVSDRKQSKKRKNDSGSSGAECLYKTCDHSHCRLSRNGKCSSKKYKRTKRKHRNHRDHSKSRKSHKS